MLRQCNTDIEIFLHHIALQFELATQRARATVSYCKPAFIVITMIHTSTQIILLPCAREG